MTNIFIKELEKRIAQRINGIAFDIALMLDCASYYIAGGACNPGPFNDIDIYPVAQTGFNFEYIIANIKKHSCKANVLHQSKNTLTISLKDNNTNNDIKLQFCNYYHETLIKLVSSFDFAHCKIGVMIHNESSSSLYGIIGLCYIHPTWFTALAKQSSFYTLSTWQIIAEGTYPLSSLIRLFKYRARGLISSSEAKKSILNILSAIISRGFYDYEDYKNQLDAIDLNLLDDSPDESHEDTADSIMSFARAFYDICRDKGLVEVLDDFNKEEMND